MRFSRLLLAISVMIAVLPVGITHGAGLPNRSSTTTENPPELITSWGGISGADGLAVDTSGNVYVTDWTGRRVVKFSTNGSFLGEWDQPSDLPSYLTGPVDIAVLPNGDIWVSEGDGFVLLNSSLVLQRYWEAPNGARYLARDPTKAFIYATGGLYIYKYDVTTGAMVTHWQFACSRCFPGPYFTGFSVGPSGTVYSQEESYVQRWTPDGQFIGGWQPAGGALAIATDSAENLFVTLGNGGVGKFTPTGTLLSTWVTPGSALWDVGVDGQGSVFVLALGNSGGTVYKYGYPTVPIRHQSLGALKKLYR